MPDHPLPAQDAAALVDLIPRLRAYARFLTRDPAAADDLVQEALARALAALPGLAEGANLKAWSFAILRNVFFEGKRRARISQRAMDATTPGTQSAPVQDEVAEMRRLEALLHQLSPLLRESLLLVGAQEMTYEEAAAICGVPSGTIKARVSRARAQLSRLAGQPTA